MSKLFPSSIVTASMGIPFENRRYGVLGPVEEFHEMRKSYQFSEKLKTSTVDTRAGVKRSNSSSEPKVDKHLASLPADLRQAARTVVDQLPSLAIAGKIAECYSNAYDHLACQKQSIAAEIKEMEMRKIRSLKRSATRGKGLMINESLQEARENKAILSWQQVREVEQMFQL